MRCCQACKWLLKKSRHKPRIFGGVIAAALLSAASLALAKDGLPSQPASAPFFAGNLAPGGSFRGCSHCSEMMIIPSGDFMMGATKEEFAGFMDRYSIFYSDETPLHKVHVQEFALAKADVTRAQFSVFVKDTGFKATGCQVYDGKTAHFDENADWRNPGFVQTEDDPVVCVSWNDAKRYIGWLNKKLHKQSHVVYRLPTEAEWEYAARAGTEGKTYWADTRLDTCKFANVRDQSVNVVDPSAPHVECNDGFVYTSPVGMFAPNSWGLFDMLGNVYQWVEDCQHVGYSMPPLAGASLATPNCALRIRRGASWATIPFGIRSASRTGVKIDSRDNTHGFRLAADIQY